MAFQPQHQYAQPMVAAATPITAPRSSSQSALVTMISSVVVTGAAILATALPYWRAGTIQGLSFHLGLWTLCMDVVGCSSLDNVLDWVKVARAFSLISVFLAVGAILAAFMVYRNELQGAKAYLPAVLLFLSGVSSIALLGEWLDNGKNAAGEWAFSLYVCIISFACAIPTSIYSLIKTNRALQQGDNSLYNSLV